MLIKSLSHFLTGLAWASCWPATFQAAKAGNPIPILLGGICALLPDTLDHWFAKPLFKPDIHIVPDPVAPDPHMIADALTLALLQSNETQKPIDIECYPLPNGPDKWIPYSLHFDSSGRKISVMIKEIHSPCATKPAPIGFSTDGTNRLSIIAKPLSLRIDPTPSRRLILRIMPSQRHWSHSLVTAFAIGLLTGVIGGLTTGLIAGGAYALHIFTHQWEYSGCALFWPFSSKRHPGFQWVKPRQRQALTMSLMWLALLLIAGNIRHHSTPEPKGPSRLQLLLFGGVIPLSCLAFYHRDDQR